MFRILRNTCVAVLLVFLCTIPVFYGLIVASIDIHGIYYPYIIARLLRFPLLILTIGLITRRNNRDLLNQEDCQKDRDLIFKLTCISLCLAAYMYITGRYQHIYGVLSGMFWIFRPDRTPLVLTCLWEQLFSGDLFWILLLSLAIVFCPPLSAVRGRRKSPSL